MQEACDRGWLRDRRHPHSRPDWHIILHLAMDICQGMAYLHSKGIVHADLSAYNIMLCSPQATAIIPQQPSLASAHSFVKHISRSGDGSVASGPSNVSGAAAGTPPQALPVNLRLVEGAREGKEAGANTSSDALLMTSESKLVIDYPSCAHSRRCREYVAKVCFGVFIHCRCP